MKTIGLLVLMPTLLIQPLLADSIATQGQRSYPKHSDASKVYSTKIEVVAAWARASISNNSAVYITLINHDSTKTKLVAAKTAIAEYAEMHQHQIINKVVKMQQLDHIKIKSGEKLTMQPGGLHIMLFGLKKKIRKGDKFSLDLIFENKKSIPALVIVREIGAIDESFKMNHKKSHSHKHMMN